MSDYYGAATLESWLENELNLRALPEIVDILEPWREEIEGSIERWMDSDTGEGRFSWRGWGRGFPDDEEFDKALGRAKCDNEVGLEGSTPIECGYSWCPFCGMQLREVRKENP